MERCKCLNGGRVGTAVVLLAFGILGCSSSTGPDPDPDPNPGPVLADIVGSWSWVQAVGGIAGQARTPESDGVIRIIAIDAPDRIRLIENGELSVDTTFELVPAQDLVDISIQAKLVYASPILGVMEQGVGFSIEGALVLVDPCCDLWIWEFESLIDP